MADDVPDLTTEVITARVRQVLLHDGHWQKSELQSITMKSVKPYIKAMGIDWSKYKAEITTAITGVMESITTESPVKAPSQRAPAKRSADHEEQEGEAEEFEENGDDEEGEDDDAGSEDEDEEEEFTDEGDYTTPQWNALPAEVKARVMEVVWAKAPQEPWWPSLIYHPMNVSGKLKKDALKFCKAKYLVHFYAGGSTPWQYVPFAQCEPFDPANLPSERLAPTQRGKPLGPKAKAQFDEAVELACKESQLENKWDRAGWLVDEERAAEREARRAERAAARASNKSSNKKPKKRPSAKAPAPSSKAASSKKVKAEGKASSGGSGSSGNGWLGATEEEIAAEDELAKAASEAVATEQRQFASMAPFKALAEMPSEPEDEESEEESEAGSEGDGDDDDYDSQAAAKAQKAAAAAEKKEKDAAKKKRPRPDEAGAQPKKAKTVATKKPTVQSAATSASPRESLKAMANDLATSLGATSADPSAVESAVTSPDTSEAAQAAATKALKGLWKFDMTAALLPEAPVKLVKALKKKHPSDKVKQQAGAIFDKWAALGKSASSAAATAAPKKSSVATEETSKPAAGPSSEPAAKPVAKTGAADEASAPPAAAPKKSEPVPHQEPEKPESATSKPAEDPAASTTALPATVAAAPTPAVVQPDSGKPEPIGQAAKPSKAPEVVPVANEKGIDAKLREKVKAAMRMKEVPEAQVSAVESALYEAAGGSERGDRGKFKELTRLLAKRLDEGNDAKSGLSSGALTPAALVAEIAAGK